MIVTEDLASHLLGLTASSSRRHHLRRGQAFGSVEAKSIAVVVPVHAVEAAAVDVRQLRVRFGGIEAMIRSKLKRIRF